MKKTFSKSEFRRWWRKKSTRIYVSHSGGKCSRPCTTCSRLFASFGGWVCFTDENGNLKEMRGNDLLKDAVDSSGRRAAKRK